MFKFFSINKKTEYSYDFTICSLMVKDKNGKYKAKCGVDKCYAAKLLNGLRAKPMRGKFEGDNIRERLKFLKSEVELLNYFNSRDKVTLRGFSFADYNHKYKDEFLHIVRNFEGRHLIISKTLWLMNDDYELLKEVSEKTTLSLGFTKKLYKPFKKFFEKHKHLKFSVNYTYSDLEELEWLKEKDPELFEQVSVFHDAYVHSRKNYEEESITAKGARLKALKTKKENLFNRVDQIEKTSLYASNRLCNMWGEDRKVKGCTNCNGCDLILRKENKKEVAYNS